jgi:hypothetical protein
MVRTDPWLMRPNESRNGDSPFRPVTQGVRQTPLLRLAAATRRARHQCYVPGCRKVLQRYSNIFRSCLRIVDIRT